MTKKDKFKQIFKNFIDIGAEYIGVYVKAPNLDEPELILNPKANANKKLNYYLNHYNDDMRLNSVNAVEIISVTGAIYLEDLEDNAVSI